MTRKNRVGGLEEMRNGLPMRTLGDKQYGHPDYAKDYFKVNIKLITGRRSHTWSKYCLKKNWT